ncbi:DUF2256 domain-containing protein [Gillisia limnaea]|uniref:Uncharacterized conserved protein UCP037205 n=1 Tax=Gillisia limnaea (strain DSM 15749 / LMG 21470 / R-8282) TaxID=865937 RepID=H2BZJ6_GILLR|nr:DUF2256 domain-containing protein [Gillisia limnaea]EHQ03405.1 Uncharacterized conserved protein UCP037205 [Gillisia limnaea DSM 15749]
MKQVKKQDLRTKICESCGLIFSWRKKWEKNWANVKYCSKKCSSQKNGKKHSLV